MIETPSGEPLVPVFDWYQYSSPTNVRDLLEVLEPIAHEEPFRDDTPKLKGYGWAKKWGGPGGSVLIHYGGRNGDQYGPNVAGTGPLAPRVADLTRAASIPHGVGRTDVRLDYLGDYDACRLRFIERCNAAGMATRDAGSCPESSMQLGRTVYGGSVSSVYQPTLYQKALQLKAQRVDGLPENYLRLEHRFTPSKSIEKAQLAALTPMEIVGLRPVARDLSLSLAELAVKPYKLTKQVKERDAYYWMLRQHSKTLYRLLDDHGSPAAVGQQMFLDLADIEEEEAAH